MMYYFQPTTKRIIIRSRPAYYTGYIIRLGRYSKIGIRYIVTCTRIRALMFIVNDGYPGKVCPHFHQFDIRPLFRYSGIKTPVGHLYYVDKCL